MCVKFLSQCPAKVRCLHLSRKGRSGLQLMRFFFSRTLPEALSVSAQCFIFTTHLYTLKSGLLHQWQNSLAHLSRAGKALERELLLLWTFGSLSGLLLSSFGRPLSRSWQLRKLNTPATLEISARAANSGRVRVFFCDNLTDNPFSLMESNYDFYFWPRPVLVRAATKKLNPDNFLVWPRQTFTAELGFVLQQLCAKVYVAGTARAPRELSTLSHTTHRFCLDHLGEGPAVYWKLY